MLKCDVAIIGAGTAGLAAERAARREGASTLLIDPAFDGTTCATVGCMPSKLLIAASKSAQACRRAPVFGIETGALAINGPAVFRRVRSERDRFAALIRRSILGLPNGVAIRSRARFTGPNCLRLDDGRTIDARSVVIATGSSPAMPPAFADLGAAVLTNETVFELDDLPTRMAVIGSGPVGLEMAQAFARLGVSVTLFDSGAKLAKLRCPRVHATLLEIIERDLKVLLETKVTPALTERGVQLRWTGSTQGEAVFDKVLVAAGRPPRLDGLDLINAGLLLDDRGVPVHDRSTMRCGDSSIFLAGDVAADIPVLHEASHDGAIAGRNAANWPEPKATSRHISFGITFTDPVTASVGLSECDGVVTGTTEFADQGRARVECRNEGALTVYAAAPDGRLIGADLAAPAGEHIAHLLSWAVQKRMTATQVLELPFYHPTIEEGLKQALRTVCKATPLALPKDQDSGIPAGS